jgi:hypothetical protein
MYGEQFYATKILVITQQFNKNKLTGHTKYGLRVLDLFGLA